jgi:hypothetical protein
VYVGIAEEGLAKLVEGSAAPGHIWPRSSGIVTTSERDESDDGGQ